MNDRKRVNRKSMDIIGFFEILGVVVVAVGIALAKFLFGLF